MHWPSVGRRPAAHARNNTSRRGREPCARTSDMSTSGWPPKPRLPIPAGVIQMVFAAQLPARAGQHGGLARGLLELLDRVSDRERFLAHVVERSAAAGRNGALHRLRLKQGEPLVREAAADAPFVAVALEAPPEVVEVVS